MSTERSQATLFRPAQARRLVHQFEIDLTRKPGNLQLSRIERLAVSAGCTWATFREIQAALAAVLS